MTATDHHRAVVVPVVAVAPIVVHTVPDHQETAVEVMLEPTVFPLTKPGEPGPVMTSRPAIPEAQTQATEEQSPVQRVSDQLRPAEGTLPGGPLPASRGAIIRPLREQATVLEQEAELVEDPVQPADPAGGHHDSNSIPVNWTSETI